MNQRSLEQSPGLTDHHADAGAAPLAVIDIGSNSVRLTVADVQPDGGYRVLDDEKVVTRLAKGLAHHHALDEDRVQATVESIANLRAIAVSHGAVDVHAIATCAVREATNGAAFIERLRAEAGVEVRIVSAEEEARFAFRSVRDAFDLHGMPSMIADIGGGSTEVVFASGNVVEQIHSFPLGAVRLTEQFDLHEDQTNERYRALRQHVRKFIRQGIGKPPLHALVLYGTGGTFTNLAAMDASGGDESVVGEETKTLRGYEVQHSKLRHLLENLRKMPIEERRTVPGLNPDRADIIVAGLIIIDLLLRHCEVNVVRVHDQGIRNGYLRMLAEERTAAVARDLARPMDRLDAVRRFADRCRSDLTYLDHVAFLAMRLFDEFARALKTKSARWKTDESRRLLEVAALLHDVGYYINYARYHKHTHHLIMHSELPGFDHRDLTLVANIARYHRRARPKQKHPSFASLGSADRRRVRRLSAILRLAVGLNRARDQRVHDVKVEVRRGVATVSVFAEHEPVVDVWGAERKAPMFEDVFDMGLRFHWIAAEPEDSGAV